MPLELSLYHPERVLLMISHELRGHIDPDGDTMGSTHALKHLLLEYNPLLEIKVSGEIHRGFTTMRTFFYLLP